MNLKVHRIIYSTYVEGPGHRACIWVQGCNRQCNGCFARETWSKEGGTTYTTDEVFKNIKELSSSIEGITFLGGEPFEQAEAVLELGTKIKNEGLSLIVFTGYTIEELKSLNNVLVDRLLNIIDVLVDGAFEIEKCDLTRPLVGSSNQRYIFLTDRYNEEILSNKNKIEMKLHPNGKIEINGMGDFNKLLNII